VFSPLLFVNEKEENRRFAWCHPVLHKGENFQKRENFHTNNLMTWIKYNQALGFQTIYIWYEENLENEINLILQRFSSVVTAT